MSTTSINSPSKTDGLTAKADGAVKQAKELGRDIKDQATELTQSATEAVKTQADNLKESAKEVASDAGDKLRAGMIEQKAAGADYLGNVANIIRRTAFEFDNDIPQAAQYIRKAATQISDVSNAVRNNDMSEIVGHVQDFARKQPTAFFGAAVLLGFAAVRFLKSGTAVAAAAPAGSGSAKPNTAAAGM
jgi:hypothetical protein